MHDISHDLFQPPLITGYDIAARDQRAIDLKYKTQVYATRSSTQTERWVAYNSSGLVFGMKGLVARQVDSK